MTADQTARQPLVLGLRPQLGWAQADDARRRWAEACVPLVALMAVVQAVVPDLALLVVPLLAATLGPPAFYSAARVLRPHVGRSAERDWRHWCAATSTAFGAATLLQLFLGEAAVSLAVVPATLGLVVTVPWGLVTVLVRAVEASAARARSGAQLRPRASRTTGSS